MEVNGKPITSLRVVDLKEELDKRGLSKSGKKDELMQRLQSWLEVNPEHDDASAENSPRDTTEDGADILEAERQQAERLRLEEERRSEERRLAEEQKLAAERASAEEARRAEEERQRMAKAEENRRRAEEEEREIAEQIRANEEHQRKMKEEEERKAEEKRREEEQQRLEQEKKEQIKRKLEEERLANEKRAREEEERRKELEKEELEKAERKKKEKEERRRKEEEEARIEQEREEKIRQEKEEKRLQEEKERAAKEAKEKQAEQERKQENASKEQRLKEELLKRLREQKEEKERKEKEDERKAKNSDNNCKPTAADKEEVGDTTLLMEVDPNDLDIVTDTVASTPKTSTTTIEKVDSDKENKDGQEGGATPTATPGQVTSLRRLGGQREGANSGSARKRGWGASRSSRISSSENIEITSNSLKDLVPDMKPLLSQNVTIEEEQEEVKKNGHSGDREEMGPSMPKQKKEEPAPTPRKKIVLSEKSDNLETNVIMVYNLTRPFTLNQLKELLKRTGELEDFWINKIKSQCVAKFKSVDQASETKMALNGVTWPQDNKNPLQVVFSSEEELERLKSTVDEVTRIVTANGASRSGIRDWDKEKLERQKEREIRRGERERSATKEPVQPSKSLEELFNKTKVIPALYWKPLSEETIQRKEEARNRKVLNALKAKRSRSRS